MIPVPYNLTTDRLDALSECLAAVNGIVDGGGVEDWKPTDNPNRPKALEVQAKLLDEITSLLSVAQPTPSAGRRTS